MSAEKTAARRRWSVVVGLLLVVAFVVIVVSRRGGFVDQNASDQHAVDESREDQNVDGGGAAHHARFVDRAALVGVETAIVSGSPGRLLIFENLGTGCAVFDFDGDGFLDIFVVSGGRSARLPSSPSSVRLLEGPGSTLYRQTGAGRFEDVTVSRGIRFTGWGLGVAVGDIENDGDLDVLVTAFGPNCLFVNDGNGTFTERGAAAGVDHAGMSTSAVFFDYDNDGLLDLYVANYVRFDLRRPPNGGEPCLERGVPVSCSPPLHEPAPDVLYRNVGGGRFRDVTVESGLDGQVGAYGLGVVAADFDRDGAVDLYVANDTTANFLWRNRRDGTFEDETYFSGAAVSENGQGQAGMGVDAADVNGDGWPDLHVTNFSLEPNALYENLTDGTFADESYRSGFAQASFRYIGWGTKFLDYNLDGRLDLVVANGHVHPRASDLESGSEFEQPCLLFRGTATGFVDVTGSVGGDLGTPRSHRGLATGDLNRDGAVDVVMTTLDGPPLVLFNEVPVDEVSVDAGSAIGFVLRGTQSNSEGIGTRIEIETAAGHQSAEVSRGGSYLSSSDARVVFGLGTETGVRRVRAVWPSGTEQEFGALEAGAVYHWSESGEVKRLQNLRRRE